MTVRPLSLTDGHVYFAKDELLPDGRPSSARLDEAQVELGRLYAASKRTVGEVVFRRGSVAPLVGGGCRVGYTVRPNTRPPTDEELAKPDPLTTPAGNLRKSIREAERLGLRNPKHPRA